MPFSSITRRGVPGLCLFALAIGLVLRLGILSQTTRLRSPIIDEQHFGRLSVHIADGDGFAWNTGEPTSRRPPLYSAMVGGIWKVVGKFSYQTVRVVQIVLAMLTALVVFQIGRRTFDDRVGWYGAALFWLYPTLIYFNFTILSETLFTLLLLTFVWLGVRLVQAPSPWVAVLCGLALGFAALTRSVLWPFPILLCPLLVAITPGRFTRRFALAALVFVGYAIPVLPWAVRNTQLQGVVTIVDTMGGRNLRMGNYEHTPDDHMWDAVQMGGDGNWAMELAAEHPGAKFSEGQIDKWAQQQAVQYILANPGITFRRAMIKFADFWGIEREYAGAVQKRYYRSAPRFFEIAATALIIVTFVGTAILGVVGAWLVRPAWRVHLILLLPIVAITGVHTLAFGHSRYHVPLMPLLGLYACALLTRRREIDWRAQRWAVVGAGITVSLFAASWARQLLLDSSRITDLIKSFV